MADGSCGTDVFGFGLICAFVVGSSGVAVVIVFLLAICTACAVCGWCSALDTWFGDAHGVYNDSWLVLFVCVVLMRVHPTSAPPLGGLLTLFQVQICGLCSPTVYLCLGW